MGKARDYSPWLFWGGLASPLGRFFFRGMCLTHRGFDSRKVGSLDPGLCPIVAEGLRDLAKFAGFGHRVGGAFPGDAGLFRGAKGGLSDLCEIRVWSM
jgi:hypothetical protein